MPKPRSAPPFTELPAPSSSSVPHFLARVSPQFRFLKLASQQPKRQHNPKTEVQELQAVCSISIAVAQQRQRHCIIHQPCHAGRARITRAADPAAAYQQLDLCLCLCCVCVCVCVVCSLLCPIEHTTRVNCIDHRSMLSEELLCRRPIDDVGRPAGALPKTNNLACEPPALQQSAAQRRFRVASKPQHLHCPCGWTSAKGKPGNSFFFSSQPGAQPKADARLPGSCTSQSALRLGRSDPQVHREERCATSANTVPGSFLLLVAW